jgi:hypothetical protein
MWWMAYYYHLNWEILAYNDIDSLIVIGKRLFFGKLQQIYMF